MLKLAGSLLDTNRIRLEALPHLDSLARACGERANLGILHRDQTLYLAGVEKPSLPTIYSRFGKTVPAHCSALGKAMLAHLPERELQDYLKRETLSKRTDATITDEAALRDELANVAPEPVRGRPTRSTRSASAASRRPFSSTAGPVAAIGLSGRALDQLMKHKEALQHTAEVISHVLSRGA